MRKFWFLTLLGFTFACSSVKAETKPQVNLTTQHEIQCKIVVKRYKLSPETYEPIEEAQVVVVGSKDELPTPADYVVLGSMAIETTSECRLDEVIDAIKEGAGGFGANYVLPWNIEKSELENRIDKWAKEKPVNNYILLRRENLSI